MGTILGLLVTVIMGLGVGALIKLIVKVAIISAKALVERIKNRMKGDVGDTVVLATLGQIIDQIRDNAEANNQAISLDELAGLQETAGEDAIIVGYEKEGKITVDNIEILSGEMDGSMKKTLEEHNGVLLVKAS